MAVDRAGRRATRIAKVFMDLTWWLGLGLLIVLSCTLLAAPWLEGSGVVAGFDWNAFHLEGGQGPPRIGVGVSVTTDSASTALSLTSTDTIQAANPVLERKADTRLEFRTRRWGFLYATNWMLMPLFAAILVGVHLLRSFLADVLKAEVFTTRNAKRLSTLGWLIIALAVANPQLERWRSWMILERIQLRGASLSPADPEGTGLWFVGVLVLVLAAAWRYGAELQEERDLTV
jgi:hypothetical protein